MQKLRRRFSLRFAFAVLTLCAALAGLWAAYIEPYRREMQSLHAMPSHRLLKTESFGPGWFRRLADGRFAIRIVAIEFDESVTDDELSQLAVFKRLRSVDIPSGPKVTDEGLSRIASLRRLETLLIGETQITPEGVRRIQAAKQLQFLWLHCDELTDAELPSIAELTELRHLTLQANVTDEGMKQLRPLKKLESLCCIGVGANAPGFANYSEETAYDFNHFSLVEVRQYFADAHRAPIRIDEQALAAAGIDAHRVFVTAYGRRQPLDDSLRTIFATYPVEVVLTPAEIVITTPAAVKDSRRGIEALERALPSLRSVDVWWRWKPAPDNTLQWHCKLL